MDIKLRKYLSLVPMVGFLINIIYLKQALSKKRISAFERKSWLPLKCVLTVVLFAAAMMLVAIFVRNAVVHGILYAILVWLLFFAWSWFTVSEEEKVLAEPDVPKEVSAKKTSKMLAVVKVLRFIPFFNFSAMVLCFFLYNFDFIGQLKFTFKTFAVIGCLSVAMNLVALIPVEPLVLLLNVLLSWVVFFLYTSYMIKDLEKDTDR